MKAEPPFREKARLHRPAESKQAGSNAASLSPVEFGQAGSLQWGSVVNWLPRWTEQAGDRQVFLGSSGRHGGQATFIKDMWLMTAHKGATRFVKKHLLNISACLPKTPPAAPKPKQPARKGAFLFA